MPTPAAVSTASAPPDNAASQRRHFSEDQTSTAEVVAAVESDVALAIAVLRVANQVQGKSKGKVDSVVKSVEVLSAQAVKALASRARTFDFFERTGVWDVAPEHFRLHALATQRAADRLATEERIHRERRELGVDHALVGGVLARRWGLPKSIASTIERHHHEDGGDEAAFVRLADMLAHYAQGAPVSPTELLKVARQIGLGPAELRSVMYELPYPQTGRQRQIDPCPLSDREVEVLKRLASGKVYKQIASELSLSTSTVRTHLHNIYGKLGAVDRAQAVLVATQRG